MAEDSAKDSAKDSATLEPPLGQPQPSDHSAASAVASTVASAVASAVGSAVAACYLESAVAKVHGGNWRREELAQRLHSSGSEANRTREAGAPVGHAMGITTRSVDGTDPGPQASAWLSTHVDAWTCQRHDTPDAVPQDPNFPVYL